MKCFVFIDGSNFYHACRILIDDKKYRLLEFDFKKFCEWLCSDESEISAKYYVGAVNRKYGDRKLEKMYADQQKLIANLQKMDIPTTLGTIIQHPDKTFHEKGVDVRIAVEMIRYARMKKYDRAFLISSDTDLVPAVEEVISIGKKVTYVGFPHNQSFGLTKRASDYIILRKEDLINCFPQTIL